MYNRRIIALPIIVLMGLTLFLFAAPQPVKSVTFILAGYPQGDGYGQGIASIEVEVDGVPFGYYKWDNASYVFTVEAGVQLYLELESRLNQTRTNAYTIEDGNRSIRHRILVTTPSNDSVFFQQNLTYMTGVLSETLDLTYYRHNVTLPFTPLEGVIYTVIIVLEIYEIDWG